jgi:UPF0755 protein
MIKKDLTFFILTLTLVVGSFAYMISELKSSYSTTEEVIFIENDISESALIQQLNEKGLIKNKPTYYFSLLSAKISEIFLSENKRKISPGGYKFAGRLTATAIDSALQEPEYKYVSVIEGMRKEEIAERVGKTLDWEENKIETFKGKYPLCSFSGREGYLAPGDYLIKRDADIQEIQEKMESQFSTKIQKLQIDSSDENDLNKIITIASLIQRESGGKKDMRLISGIIHNRLNIGMPLQIDATLQYVKGEDGLWWPRVKSEDKYLDSPFNTYQNSGLPPQPIANPGSAAIEAANNPIETSCLFYLHDKSGNIHCSSDYERHLSNIKRYLK